MPSRRKRLMRVSCVLAIFAGLLAAMLGLWSRHTAQMAQRLGEQLEHAPQEELLSLARRLTRLGDAALPALCEALGSSRVEVADAAESALREELARWEMFSPRKASSLLLQFSVLLAQQAASPKHVPSRRLAELATHVIATSPAGLRQMPQIARNCQQVIDAAAASLPEPRLLAAHDAQPLPPVFAEARPAALESHEPPLAKTADFAEPAPVEEPRPLPPAAAPPELLPLDSADIREARPINAVSEPLEKAPQMKPVAPRSHPPRIPLEQLNTLPLAKLLHSPDADTVRAAREELNRRGHPPLEVYLQERLTDPDPRVRAAAVESLPSMSGLDARPWLLALSRDENADVRLVTLTLMATSGESRMLRRVQEMAQADPDARVRSQAQRAKR